MKLAARALLVICATSLPIAANAACDVAIRFNDVTVMPRAQKWLEQELQTAASKVCTWWGPTFSGPLTIDVNSSTTAAMSLVPAWRGQSRYIIFPVRTVMQSTAATTHEMVHIFAPNANRFLAEGLAVHAHDLLGGPPAFPNSGQPLHAAARPYAQKADIAALERLATPAYLELGGSLPRQGAYLVGGSFVRFLIEQHGMEKFRRLYAMTPFMPGQKNAGDPGRWRTVYGVPLDDLAAAWRQWVTGAGN